MSEAVEDARAWLRRNAAKLRDDECKLCHHSGEDTNPGEGCSVEGCECDWDDIDVYQEVRQEARELVGDAALTIEALLVEIDRLQGIVGHRG